MPEGQRQPGRARRPRPASARASQHRRRGPAPWRRGPGSGSAGGGHRAARRPARRAAPTGARAARRRASAEGQGARTRRVEQRRAAPATAAGRARTAPAARRAAAAGPGRSSTRSRGRAAGRRRCATAAWSISPSSCGFSPFSTVSAERRGRAAEQQRRTGSTAARPGSLGAVTDSVGRRVASNTAVQVAGKAAVLAIGGGLDRGAHPLPGAGDYGRYTLALMYMQLFAVLADVGLFTTVVREISKRARAHRGAGGQRADAAAAARRWWRSSLAVAMSLLLPYEPDVRRGDRAGRRPAAVRDAQQLAGGRAPGAAADGPGGDRATWSGAPSRSG